MQIRRQWNKNFNTLKEKKTWYSRILYLLKTSLKIQVKISIFLGKNELREFVTSRPALQQMLKEVLQEEGKLFQIDTK